MVIKSLQDNQVQALTGLDVDSITAIKDKLKTVFKNIKKKNAKSNLYKALYEIDITKVIITTLANKASLVLNDTENLAAGLKYLKDVINNDKTTRKHLQG